MNIGLLISGNLTGFGRFYTSPAASDLLGNEKISFDNHSFLPFLGDDEKAYSITFAKRLIAISQYTQILDSFRRPGKLVVSLLIPRNYAIESNSGSPRGAVYSLLTKISNRFFEKNFLDGMINQNLAVLGQDYYSEILEGYSLKPIDSKRINENPAPMKKVGYVRAAELDMPSYLDTPYRKSYGDGGYNLIFFAPSAPVGTPNSIDEEPEEVVLYRVKILNTGAILPNPVKLSSPLYKLQARAGEKQFPDEGTYKLTNDYLESRPSTYQDVIDHFLEPRITGRIVSGDTLEIQYNFEKEEKTIKFVFVDMATSTPVSLDLVLPSIVFSDGSRQPISSDTFTFRGSEIYDEKRLVAENASISISSRSEKLDLTRSSNGQEYKVYVQQGFSLSVNPELMGITISFVNRSTRQTLSFTNQNKINLPGKASDWNVYVDTEQYSAPVQALKVQNNGRWAINNLQQKIRKEVKEAENLIKPSGSAVAIQSKPWSLPHIRKIGGQDANVILDDERNRNFKWHKYIVLIPIVLLVLGGGWWAIPWIFNQQESRNDEGNTVVGEGDRLDRGFYLVYYDNDPVNTDTLTTNIESNFSYQLKDDKGNIIIDDFNTYLNGPHELLERKESWTQKGKCHLIHKIILNNYEEDFNALIVSVSYICGSDTLQLVDCEIDKSHVKSGIDNFETIPVNLGIKLSQRKWYDELSNKNYQYPTETAKNDKISDIVKLDLIKSSEFSKKLLKLAQLREVKKADKGSTKDAEQPKILKISDLSSTNCTLSTTELARYKPYENQVIDGITVKERIKALIIVNSCLNGKYVKGKVARPDVEKLSPSQRLLIERVFNTVSDQLLQKHKKKNFSSIQDFYDTYQDLVS